MNSYEKYLEDMIEVQQKEIKLYKKFIEEKLKCTIKEEVRSAMKFERAAEEAYFKIITIPQSQYVIEVNNPNILDFRF